MTKAIGFAAFILLICSQAAAQRDFSVVEISVADISDGIYMLQGAGGNIGLSIGEDGPFVIDDQFAPLSEKIMAAIASRTDDPVAFVLNTHWHGDHTGGNEAFGKAGAHIVAHENVRKRLKAGLTRGNGSEVDPAPPEALPVITFDQSMSFYWNGRTIRVRHPDQAHTDGDSIVFFVDANVLHTGDLFFNGSYPYIDLESGGDLDGYIAAQEEMLSTIDADTKIIPGHGPLASKQDLQNSLNVLKEVRSRVQTAIDDGLSADEAVAGDLLNDLNEDWGQGFINGERMVRIAHAALLPAGE